MKNGSYFLRPQAGEKFHEKSCVHERVKRKIKSMENGIGQKKVVKNKKSEKGPGGKG